MGRLVDLNDAKALIENIYKRDKDTINMSYKKDNIINGLDELDTAYDVDAVVEEINKLGRTEMWNDASPIWLRPQHSKMKLYKPRKLLQVVGHTPVEGISRAGNLISCDVFSTRSDGSPIGTEEYLLLNTLTWEFCGIRTT